MKTIVNVFVEGLESRKLIPVESYIFMRSVEENNSVDRKLVHSGNVFIPRYQSFVLIIQ